MKTKTPLPQLNQLKQLKWGVTTLKRLTQLIALSLIASACSSPYQNQDPTGQTFPNVSAEALDGEAWALPKKLLGKPALLLLGYVQDTQFDIDRWLIGVELMGLKVKAYELPTIKGLFPRMFSSKIDEGMRKGIPKALWGGVITVYRQGEELQRFTGNERPRNARVMLLDAQGVVRFFTDEGFSVEGVKRLKQALQGLSAAPPSPPSL